MVSTVTATTVTLLSGSDGHGSLGLVALATLLVLLVQREALSARSSPRAQAFVRVVDVAIAPLLLACLLLVIATVSAVLG